MLILLVVFPWFWVHTSSGFIMLSVNLVNLVSVSSDKHYMVSSCNTMAIIGSVVSRKRPCNNCTFYCTTVNNFTIACDLFGASVTEAAEGRQKVMERSGLRWGWGDGCLQAFHSMFYVLAIDFYLFWNHLHPVSPHARGFLINIGACVSR